VPTDVPAGPQQVVENFVKAVSDGTELLCPGEEGLWSVELANAMILSAKRHKEVPLPVDRAEYDALMDELCAESSFSG